MIIKELRNIFQSFFKHCNDDYVDRLHYLHTVVILSAYLLFITSKTYYGDPIHCFVNNHGEASKFVHSMCWINGTFHSEEADENNIIYGERKQDRLGYYQWIIFVICFQCLLFSIPSSIWNFFIYLNGFNMVHVTKTIIPQIYLDEYSDTNWSKAQGIIESITDHIKMSFLDQKNSFVAGRYNFGMKGKHKVTSKQNGDDQVGGQNNVEKKLLKKASSRKRNPNLKTKTIFLFYASYLLTKLIYLGVIVLNFEFLSWMFSFNYYTYGIDTASMGFNSAYIDQHFFPKRGFCQVKFYSKKYANIGSYFCTLPLNLFNQVFYIAFWFWLVFLSLFTVISILNWLLLSITAYRRKYVLNCLQLGQDSDLIKSYTAACYLDDAEQTIEMVDFCFIEKTGLTLMQNFNLFFQDVCSIDVVFVVKLIELNSNNLASRDILNNLWDQYLGFDKVKDLKKRPVIELKRHQMLVPPMPPQNRLYELQSDVINEEK